MSHKKFPEKLIPMTQSGRYFARLYNTVTRWWGLNYHEKAHLLKYGAFKKGPIFEQTNCGRIVFTGVNMEKAGIFLKEINEDVSESAKILQKTFNEVNSTYQVLEPLLTDMIKRIRSARQTINVELKTAMGHMKDCRKFFLEKEYETEIARLKEFIGLCERMRELANDGTLDVITDIILKFAEGGPDE